LSHKEKLLAQVFDGLGGSQFCRSMGEVDSVSTICACSKQQEAGTMDRIHAKFWNRGVKMKPTMSMLLPIKKYPVKFLHVDKIY